MGGGPSKITPMLIVPLHDITVTLKGMISFSNVFREPVTQTIDLVAQFDDPRKKCCDIMQLKDGVPLSRPFDPSRINGAAPR
jgi:hypothetical protein